MGKDSTLWKSGIKGTNPGFYALYKRLVTPISFFSIFVMWIYPADMGYGGEADSYHTALQILASGGPLSEDNMRMWRFSDTPDKEHLIKMLVDNKYPEFLALFSKRLMRIQEEQEKIFVPNIVTSAAIEIELWQFSDALWTVFMEEEYPTYDRCKVTFSFAQIELIFRFLKTGMLDKNPEIREHCGFWESWLDVLLSCVQHSQLSLDEQRQLLSEAKEMLEFIDNSLISDYKPQPFSLTVPGPLPTPPDEPVYDIWMARDAEYKARWAKEIRKNHEISLRNNAQISLKREQHACQTLIKCLEEK